ncbi:response regulator [Salegentibacter sp. HM20]
MRKIHISLILLLLFLSTPLLSQDSLRVGVYDNAPKIFLDEKNKPQGIFIDLIEKIAAEENIYLEYRTGAWSDLLDALEQGKIDLLPDMAYSAERDSIFKLSGLPVIGSWLEIFTHTPNAISSMQDLDGKRIGLLAGSVQADYFAQQAANDFNISYRLRTYETQPELVEALKDKKLDGIVADRFMAFSTYMNNSLFPSGIVLRPIELYLGFSPQTPASVVSVFDSHISAQKNDPGSVYYSSLKYWFDEHFRNPIPQWLIWLLYALTGGLILSLFFAFLLDLNVRRKTRELQEAKVKAEESDRLKSAFLQNMSHEIRTPMNGIIGFMQLLKEPDLEASKRQKYINIVIKSGNRLLTTINNIIEFSKINSKQVEVNLQPVSLPEVMEFQYNFFKLHAAENNIQLKIGNQIMGPGSSIKTDRHILEGVLTNLINNAIKFTTEGSISFGNYVKEDRIIFYVKDSGVGIPQEKLDTIFKPFVQGHVNMNRPYEGSGLGLSIVKEHLRLLDGNIWVKQNPNKGSSFYFDLPYNPTEIPETELESALNPLVESFKQKAQILVAEDDNISYFLLERILKKAGLEVKRARNGQEVIEIFEKQANFELILMDMKMPELNGIEATKIIREKNSEIAIIAQTAYTQASDKDKAIEAGCDDFITKPIEPAELLQKISKYIPEPSVK